MRSFYKKRLLVLTSLVLTIATLSVLPSVSALSLSSFRELMVPNTDFDFVGNAIQLDNNFVQETNALNLNDAFSVSRRDLHLADDCCVVNPAYPEFASSDRAISLHGDQFASANAFVGVNGNDFLNLESFIGLDGHDFINQEHQTELTGDAFASSDSVINLEDNNFAHLNQFVGITGNEFVSGESALTLNRDLFAHSLF